LSVIEDWGLNFHLGNVVKYIARAGRKPQTNHLDDIQKAYEYLRRYLQSNGINV
jgi:uncharacterized protein Veg